MTSTVSAQWTCDRCAATTTVGHGKQPSGWVRILSAAPPQHAEPTSQGDICGDCWEAFCEWWRAPLGPEGWLCDVTTQRAVRAAPDSRQTQPIDGTVR